MIGRVITFDRDITAEEMDRFRRAWHEADSGRARKDVVLAFGGDIKVIEPPKGPSASFLRRARSKVR